MTELRWMLRIAVFTVLFVFGIAWGIAGIVQMFLVPWPRASRTRHRGRGQAGKRKPHQDA